MKHLYRIHDRIDLLCILITQIKPEVLLHGKDEFDAVEGVEAQVFEGGGAGELGVVALGGGLEHLEDLAFDELDHFGVALGTAGAEGAGLVGVFVELGGES